MKIAKRSFNLLLSFAMILSGVFPSLGAPRTTVLANESNIPVEVMAETGLREFDINVDWSSNMGNDMHGVGGSFAFNKAHSLLQISEFQPEVTERLVHLMFDPVTGTGQHALRSIIGDGGVRSIGSYERPGFNPINGVRADRNNPGFDIEGNAMPMSTRIFPALTQADLPHPSDYTNAHWQHAARLDQGSMTEPAYGVFLADPDNHGFATNGMPLYGAFGFTLNDWGNRHIDGASDTIWPNEFIHDEDGNLISTLNLVHDEDGNLLSVLGEGFSGFVWDLPQWNEPIPGDTGGFTNNFIGPGLVEHVTRPRLLREVWDVDQVWIARQAQHFGIQTLLYSSWTPVYWMKTSMSIFGTERNARGLAGGAQAADFIRLERDEFDNRIYFQAYADYLAAVVWGQWQEFGLRVTHIEPYNESENSHGYSGFRARGSEEVHILINEYIIPTFDRLFAPGGEKYGLLSPDGEPLNWMPGVIIGSATNLNNAFNPTPPLQFPGGGINAGMQFTGPYFANSDNWELGNSGRVIASTHLYGSVNNMTNTRTMVGTVPFGSQPLIAPFGNHFPEHMENFYLWQTEWMTQDGNNSHSGGGTQKAYNQTIDDAIRFAFMMTNMFRSEPGFNAYFNWWTLGHNGANGSDLIRVQTTGQPQAFYGSSLTGTYHIFKRFFTFGHFSRFTNVGDIRLNATAHHEAGNWLNSLAYRTPDGDDFSLTITNADYEAVIVNVTVSSWDAGNISSMTAFRTSDSENMRKLDNITVTQEANDWFTFSMEVPAQSVVTFVPESGTFATFNCLNDGHDLYSSLIPVKADGHQPGSVDRYLGNPTETTGINGFDALTMRHGDAIVFENMYFACGSINGGIVRRRLLYFLANIENAPTGGILHMYVAEPGTPITDPSTEALLVAELLIPQGTNEPMLRGITQRQNTGLRSTRVNTSDIGAYEWMDIYFVAYGEEGSDLFTISRFRWDANDDGTNTNPTPIGANIPIAAPGNVPFTMGSARAIPVGILYNGDFSNPLVPAVASSGNNTPANPYTVGWNAVNAMLQATNRQNFNGLSSPLNSVHAFSGWVNNRTDANSGIVQNLTEFATGSGLVEGEIYTFHGMFMPTQDGVTASIELIYLDSEGEEISRRTVAQREDIGRLPAREGWIRDYYDYRPGTELHTPGMAFAQRLFIPIVGLPMTTTAVNPVSHQPYGWHEVSGTFEHNPPAGTESVLLKISDDSTANFYVDQLTLFASPDRLALLEVLNSSDASEELAIRARALFTNANATQLQINALIEEYNDDYGSAPVRGGIHPETITLRPDRTRGFVLNNEDLIATWTISGAQSSDTTIRSTEEGGFLSIAANEPDGTIIVRAEIENVGTYISVVTVSSAEGSSIIDTLDRGLPFFNYPALREVYQDYFLMGSVSGPQINPGAGSNWANRRAVLGHNYNSVTFGNDMKPEPLRGNDPANRLQDPAQWPGHVRAGAASLNPEQSRDYALAAYENMVFYGHTTAWHSQSPAWMWDRHEGGTANRDIALENMQHHIRGFFELYGDWIWAVDVVNEPFGSVNPNNPEDWRFSLSRGEGWYPTLGYDWVTYSFIFAAEIVDELGLDVQLYLNEFNLATQAKGITAYAYIRDTNRAHAAGELVHPITGETFQRENGRMLIEGVGMQDRASGVMNIENWEASIVRFASLGLRIAITELDLSWRISSPDGRLTAEEEMDQAIQYARLFELFRRYASGPANAGSPYPSVIDVVTTFALVDDPQGWNPNMPSIFNAPEPYQGPGNIMGYTVTGKYALLGTLDPQRFLEVNPWIPAETPPVDGVHVFNLDVDGFSGMNIILGNDVNRWPFSSAAEDGVVAFNPQPGATYLMRVYYQSLETFGLEAHWIVDNSQNNFTSSSRIAAESMQTITRGNVADGQVANSIPNRFFNPGVSGSYAFLETTFTMPADAQPGDLLGNIALRGYQEGHGISIETVRIYRLNEDGDDVLLVNYPHRMPLVRPVVPGIIVPTPNDTQSNGRADIIIGSGRDVWPFADAHSSGVAFNPVPGTTYRIMFNIQTTGANGWRVRWMPGTGGEDYTTRDSAIVNDHPLRLSTFGLAVPSQDVIDQSPIATVIPSRPNQGVSAAGVYTIIQDITLDGDENFQGLIGNIALRGDGGSGNFVVNWISIQELAEGPGSEAIETLNFWPFGVDAFENFSNDPVSFMNTVQGFERDHFRPNVLNVVNNTVTPITRIGETTVVNAINPPQVGDVLLAGTISGGLATGGHAGAPGSLRARSTQSALFGNISYEWIVDEEVVHVGNELTVTSELIGQTIQVRISSDWETGSLMSASTVAVIPAPDEGPTPELIEARDALELLIAHVNELVEEDFTSSSWYALNVVLFDAIALVDSYELAAILEIIIQLEDAIYHLEICEINLVAQILRALIEKANYIETELFTEESLALVETAVSIAQLALKIFDLEIIILATEALEIAIEGLVEIEDEIIIEPSPELIAALDSLSELIELKETVDYTEYSEASIEAFITALDVARVLLISFEAGYIADNETAIVLIEAVKSALIAAYEALSIEVDLPGDDDGDYPGDDDGDYPGDDDGDYPGDDDGDYPGDDDGDYPGDDDGDYPGDDDGDYPGDDDGDYPGDDDGDYPGDDDSDYPGDDDGDYPGDNDGEEPGDDDGEKPGDDDEKEQPTTPNQPNLPQTGITVASTIGLGIAITSLATFVAIKKKK